MERRSFIKGLAFIGLCPLCARPSFAAEGAHWSYEGEHGPDHWGALGADNAACSVGSQQSPLDITGAVEAEIPAIALDWKKGQRRDRQQRPHHPGQHAGRQQTQSRRQEL